MGDHTHAAGEWMLSYRYMRMRMNGNRDGTSDESRREVLADFVVVPERMDMEMHMLGVMHAPSDRLTLMAMVPLVRLEMDHLTGMGGRFTTKADGLGDVSVTALWSLHASETARVHLNLGVSTPTGSVVEKDRTPMGRVRLPYPMQLGSGSVDFMPGVTLQVQQAGWSWGAQASARLRPAENRKDYQLGNRYGATGWVARRLRPELSVSLRVAGELWQNTHGSDPALNPAVVPTADPDRRGGKRIDVLGGVNWHFQSGPLRGHRLALEVGLPAYQWLDGPQLETDWTLTLGWQRAF